MSEENDKPKESAEPQAMEPTSEAVQTETGDSAVAEAKELRALLEEARSKADQHWNQMVRIQAELENVRRRTEREVENAHKYGLERFAQELLPVRDSLELGLSAVASDESAAKVREGMELTLKVLTAAMEKFGIKEVNPVGAPFNPAFHQAIAANESASQPANTVLHVMQKGYTLNDRLVRPALVVVAKAPSQAPGSSIDEKA